MTREPCSAPPLPADSPRVLDFPPGLCEAVFLRREKRFRVLVEMEGREVWVHTNNSGSMLGLIRSGARALVSPAANPARKLPFTLECLEKDGSWVCVNTLAPNRILRRACELGLLPGARGYPEFRPEARTGRSRLDARLEGPAGVLWVEAKNVTLVEDGVAAFPDAKTDRGRRHLEELIRLKAEGARVATFYLVPMEGAACFGPADFIDPDYARALAEALRAGVEAWPWQARVTPQGVRLLRPLPLAPELAAAAAP